MTDDQTRWRPRARRLLPLLLASLVLSGGLKPFAVAAPQEPAQPAATPRVEIEPLDLDLGQLVRGESTEGRFRIRNLGDDTLRIERVKPG